MYRLFVALTPPRPIRERLLTLTSGVPGARWQNDGQLHLTLRFIGEVDGRVAEDLAAVLGQVHAAPLRLTLHGVGAFDRHGRVEALWAGIARDEALAGLHRKIDQALVRAGQAPERRAYLPHITLARFSRGPRAGPETARWLADHAALSSEPFETGHFALFESHLGHAGAEYEMVSRWPLTA